MQQISDPMDMTRNSIAAWLDGRVRAKTNKPVCRHTPLADQGMTSLHLTELAMEISREFAVMTSAADVLAHPSVDAISGFIVEQVLEDSESDPEHRYPARQVPVAVIGMACRFPGGCDTPQRFWNLLINGESGLGQVPADRWDVQKFHSAVPCPGKSYVDRGGFIDDMDAFDAELFGISPKEAIVMDPQHRQILQTAWHALEDAGTSPRSMAGTNTGVFIGICGNDYADRVKPLHEELDIHAATGSFNSLAAQRISYHLDLTGPSMAVDTASSASLAALHTAVLSLSAGECTTAIAGGVNLILSPEMHIMCSRAGLMARDATCKTFDEAADGYIRAEGCGVVILKPLAQALKDGDRIQAVIAGSAMNQDGRSNGITAPNKSAQQDLLRQALRNAGLTHDRIQYIETHGTGTPLGDPVEVEAITEVFRRDERDAPVMLGSVKPAIGHAEAAAGMAGFIKTVLSLHHEAIPSQQAFKTLNHRLEPFAASFDIPRKTMPWPDSIDGKHRAGVSGFSIGGTNVHLILEAPPRQKKHIAVPRIQEECLLPLGADDESRLRFRAASHAAMPDDIHDMDLAAMARTEGIATNTERVGTVVYARNRKELVRNLKRFSETGTVPGPITPPTNPAFLFTGQGAQHSGMGKALYAGFSTFRQCVDTCAEIVEDDLDTDIRTLLVDAPQEILNQTQYTQPALFVHEYALAQLWMDWGIRPSAMLGHSVGEYVAACVAGVFTLEEALQLVIKRGKLISRLPKNGGMLAVLASEQQVRDFLRARYGEIFSIDIAAINGPENVVLSGHLEELLPLAEDMNKSGIKTVPLTVSHAFHSSLLDPILDEFHTAAQNIAYSPPTIPIISNVTGSVAYEDLLQSPDYWRDHLRYGVRFAEGMQTLADFGIDCMAEAGPAPILTGMGRRCLPAFQGVWIAPPPAPHDNQDATGPSSIERSCLRQFVEARFPINWKSLFPGQGKTALAPTRFKTTRFLLPPVQTTSGAQSLRDALATACSMDISPEEKNRRAQNDSPLLQWVAEELWTRPENLSLDKPLTTQGLDSLMAFRLAETIRNETGRDVPLAAIMQDSPARLIAEWTPNIEASTPSLSQKDRDRQEIVPDPANATVPFPLTDIQHAYWVGRGEMDSGNVSCHLYLELDLDSFDANAANRAINALIHRHAMLRTVILDNGTQQVLAEVPTFTLPQTDLRDMGKADIDVALSQRRNEMSHAVHPSDRWPLFALHASLLPEEETRLHISFDLLIGDGQTLLMLGRELSALYDATLKDDAPEENHLEAALKKFPSLNLSFRDCVLHEEHGRQSDHYRQAEAYWQDKLHDIAPAPELPASSFSRTDQHFVRRSGRLPAALWGNLKTMGSKHGLTPSGLLLAAFSEVIGTWSATQDFTLTLTMFNRPSGHPDIENLAGDFTSALLHTVSMKPETFLQRATAIQQNLWQDLEHREYSGVRVLRKLRAAGQASSMPVVFTSLLPVTRHEPRGFYPTSMSSDPIRDIPFALFQTPQVHFDHQAWEENGDLKWNWDMVESRYPEGMVDAMFDTYSRLLEDLAQSDAFWQAPAPCRLPLEQRQRRRDANDTASPLPTGPLHAPIMKRIVETPDETAIIFREETISYSRLGKAVAAIAEALIESGVQPADPVAVAVPKHWLQIASVIAVMQAGGAYIPLDPDLPAKRMTTILEQAKARVVMVLSDQTIALPDEILRINADTCLERPDSAYAFSCTGCPPHQLAYIIFTSGSTGTPKGVAISHAAARNTCEDMNKRFRITTGDSILGLARLNFDLSVYDIFGVLGAGATLVLPEQTALRDPEAWRDLLIRHKVTLWNSVPAQLEMLVATLENDCHFAGQKNAPAIPPLRLALISGDWIPLTIPERVQSVIPTLALHSLGGATEAAIWSIHYPVETVSPNWKSIPYGRAMANQTVQVLAPNGYSRPDWVPGELFIGGAGLAQGYYNDEQRTAEAFVEHPATGERLYRTGDLGRWLPDGNIEFLGRNDFQIKIRGHRIELGEMESAAMAVPSVREAIATAAPLPSGGRALALFFITTGDAGDATQQIRTICTDALPDYMRPDVIVPMTNWPMTPSGKIDRKQLILPDELPVTLSAAKGHVENRPLSEAEQRLATIWTTILETAVTSPMADFFALGGDSLLAIRLTSAIRKAFCKQLPLGKVFSLSTLEAQAAWLAEQDECVEELPAHVPSPEEAHEPFPLSDIQQAYWIGRGDIYALGNISTHIYLEIDSVLSEPTKLEACWNDLIRRHPMLRAVVDADGRQRVLPLVPHHAFPTADLRQAAADEREKHLTAVRDELSHQVLNPAQWPLFDIRLSRLDADTTRIHLSFDALCVDIWSLFLVLDEWEKLYRTKEDGQSMPLPEPAITFRDYILAERRFRESPTYAKAKRYWTSRLETLPGGPELPLATRPEKIRHPRFERREHTLPPEMWQRLKSRASQQGITPSSLLCAAYTRVLARWSASPRFCINLTLFNRLPIHEDVNNIVGDFTSLSLLEVPDASLSENRNFEHYAQALQEQLWRDLDHRHFGGVEVMRDIARLSGDEHGVIPVVFTSAIGSEALGRDASIIEAFGTQRYAITQTPQIWLDHQVYENGDGLAFNWDFVAGLFPEGMVDAMFDAYRDLLQQLAGSDAWEDITVCLPTEQATRREQYNDTTKLPIAIPGTVPDQASLTGPRTLFTGLLFHATRQPDAMAVITPDARLSYADLRSQSVAVSRYIREQGIPSGSAVAVMLPRGLRQVIAVAGIVMAGCHYIPISPESPAQRTTTILDNAECRLVVTTPDIAATLNTPLPCLTAIPPSTSTSATGSVEKTTMTTVSPGDIAYCIYTSGSTGVPKGVVIDHQGPCNTFDDLKTRFGITAHDRVLGLANLTFDLSVFDIFGILDAGGTIIFPEPEREKDPARWLELLREHGVTIWNTVPMLMEVLVEYCEATKETLPEALRLCMMSGDWIPLTLPDRIHALAPNCRVVSLGGATEASIWSILHPVETVDETWTSIPYGRPMFRQQIHVLSATLVPCPEWTVGELYIGGAGLALGYLGDEVKTTAQFITHPESGERLYRTGDLGFFHPDGTVRFMGRNDNQIKLRGHRIELGEVESAARQVHGVANAVAVVTQTDADANLTLYFQHDSIPDETPDIPALRAAVTAALIDTLPPYMIPDSLVRLDRMPLSTNGKVDRKALPAPTSEDTIHTRHGNQATPAQMPSRSAESDSESSSVDALVRIIEDILADLTGHDCSDHVTSFFELGTNSLHLIRLQNRLIKELDIPLDAVTIFANPTIRQLAEAISAMSSGNAIDSTADTGTEGRRPRRAASNDRRRSRRHNRR